MQKPALKEEETAGGALRSCQGQWEQGKRTHGEASEGVKKGVQNGAQVAVHRRAVVPEEGLGRGPPS